MNKITILWKIGSNCPEFGEMWLLDIIYRTDLSYVLLRHICVFGQMDF
jgi:hypothetical protein